MTDQSEMYISTQVHPMDLPPGQVRRVKAPGFNFVTVDYGPVSVLLTDTGLDRLSDAIAAFRASETQQDAA